MKHFLMQSLKTGYFMSCFSLALYNYCHKSSSYREKEIVEKLYITSSIINSKYLVKILSSIVFKSYLFCALYRSFLYHSMQRITLATVPELAQ